ncbi:hypothetical protein BGZ94_006596, partial [Podila epigama]
MSNVDDPQVTLNEPTPPTNEHTSLLHPTSPYANDRTKPRWYWPWEPSYWAAIPAIFLAGMAYGPSWGFLAPMLKELFCERGIPEGLPGHHPPPPPSSPPGEGLLSLLSNMPDRCNSAEYSAAVAKFSGISFAITSII